MMSKDHRENLNLLFYDFNFDAHKNLKAIAEEAGYSAENLTNG